MNLRKSGGSLSALLFVPVVLLALSALSASARESQVSEPVEVRNAYLETVHQSMMQVHRARALARTGDLKRSESLLKNAYNLAESVPEFNAQGPAYYELPRIVERAKSSIARQRNRVRHKRDRGTGKITR